MSACSKDSTGPDDPPPADPVTLVQAGVVGREVFPIGNTAQGGQGQRVGGVECITGTLAYHIHAHVNLFVNGEQLAIPAGIGIVDPVLRNGYVGQGSCFYWIHTHDATGILHIEPPTPAPMTLGQLFDVWGQPLARDNVAGFQGPVIVYVNGMRYRGDPRTISFSAYMEVTLYVGTPLAPLPSYIFPPGL